MLRFTVLISFCLSLQAWSVPAAPSSLTATPTGISTIDLSWQDNSNDEARFLIGRRTSSNEAFTLIGSVPAGTISVSNINLSPRTTYHYIVVAEDAAGSRSPASNAAVATTFDLLLLADLEPPILNGTAPSAQASSAGAPPLSLSVGSVFTDPDVGTAARLVTDLGNIDFVFFAGAAPLTVANFLNYLNRGDFNNSFFHRSVPGFVIQGGSFRADATASPIPTDPPVINEPLISNTRGTVSMAKIGGSPNSATSGFFISLADNSAILNPQNGGFTVFARVAGAGMTVVDAIATLPIQNYTSVRSALTDTPYRVPPATPYNPNNLARVLSTSFISPLSLSASSSNSVITNAGVSAGNLILTPISPGISTITLTATDLDGLTATTNFTFTVTPDTYESWAARQSFATAQDGLAGADPDRDGRSNLAEFALASPPLAASEADLLPSITSGKFNFQFPLRQYTTGVTVTLESAEILNGPWTSQWSAQDGFPHPWITSAVTSGNAQIITAQNPSAAILPRQFLRLKVTKP